ncbi:MAG: Fe-S-binding domain-containing protein, partial [Acidobacteria bacterium]|nr:Fe-S-binding domain-containing protein [Acidobacteriota bacterium]
MNTSIISIVTFLPLAGGLILLLLPRNDNLIRRWALFISVVEFFAAVHIPFMQGHHFERAAFFMQENYAWISAPAIRYHVVLDGISIWLVILTAFLTPFCVLISWRSVHDRVREFFFLLLVLETALTGVFVAFDLFLFYFFWEATLIPMALLIGMYGHERRIYAAV